MLFPSLDLSSLNGTVHIQGEYSHLEESDLETAHRHAQGYASYVNLHHVKLTTKINNHQEHKQQIRSGREAWRDKLEERVTEKMETEMQTEQMCTKVKESWKSGQRVSFHSEREERQQGRSIPLLAQAKRLRLDNTEALLEWREFTKLTKEIKAGLRSTKQDKDKAT